MNARPSATMTYKLSPSAQQATRAACGLSPRLPLKELIFASREQWDAGERAEAFPSGIWANTPLLPCAEQAADKHQLSQVVGIVVGEEQSLAENRLPISPSY